MKTKRILLAMVALVISTLNSTLFAYQLSAVNEDGVTIYYNYINGGQELKVTYKGSLGEASYTGTVVIPSEVNSYRVTSIGENAFRSCSGLTSITIPNSVTSIRDYAFSGCSSLTSIIIPNSVTSIGALGFSYCTALTSITIPNSVTSIGQDAFESCSGLTSITIPNSVTSIGDQAFLDCSNLTSITIPNSVTSIGGGAFSRCTSLTSITIPNSVTSIGSGAFSGCSGLTSITIPNSVTSIGKQAFDGCTSLTSIIIPNSVTSIETQAFYGCSGLTSITIPNSVTSIGEGAFSRCTSLTSITIPNRVTSIGKWAFQYCSGVTSITIPNSVTSIGDYAFVCSHLTSVTVGIENPVSISSNTFTSNRTNATLYVPYGSKDAYEAAPYWQEFGTIVELPNPNAITVGSTGYATFCSPKAMDFTNVDGIKAYIASGFEPSTGTLVLTRAMKVPAGEGLYIVGTPGTSATYNVPETTTDMVYSNLLKGVTSATTISPTDGENTNFILANGTHGVGFYTLSGTGEIAAGKAYLQLPTASLSSNVKAITFAFSDDSETGINETKDVREVKEVYNLQGQRVSQPKHGLYIINGKKVIIK